MKTLDEILTEFALEAIRIGASEIESEEAEKYPIQVEAQTRTKKKFQDLIESCLPEKLDQKSAIDRWGWSYAEKKANDQAIDEITTNLREKGLIK